MLANGATLEYKKSGATAYTKLEGLKEIPEIGKDPEKVDNTCLADEVKQYENGIGDAGDLTYKFKYENKSATSPYRLMRELETSGETASFKETLKDGTVTEYDAQVSVKRTGGGVNGAIEFNLSMSLQSDFTITDPA
ncbi:MAG: phage tail tube protein [Lachnospiraceae bacterium]|nr:phage tail tube protein [Lachnospiraceae bacterium]